MGYSLVRLVPGAAARRDPTSIQSFATTGGTCQWGSQRYGVAAAGAVIWQVGCDASSPERAPCAMRAGTVRQVAISETEAAALRALCSVLAF